MKPILITKYEVNKIKRLSYLYQKIESIDTYQGKDIYIGLSNDETDEYEDLKTFAQDILPIDRS